MHSGDKGTDVAGGHSWAKAFLEERAVWAKVWKVWGKKPGMTAGIGNSPTGHKGRAGGRTGETNQGSRNTEGFVCFTKEFAPVL